MTMATMDGASDFGAHLRLLRKRARLTQRDLGIATGYTESQICRFEKNAKPPELTALIAVFVPALGLNDAPRDLARLLELAAAARGELLPASSITLRPTTTSLAASGFAAANVPAQTTSLMGRTRDIEQVGALFRDQTRLLTLCGPPGVGKTRVAIDVAEQLAGMYADGAHFVALAPVESAAQVADAVFTALEIAAKPGQTARDAVAVFLKRKHLLLVLDNFEHVLDAAEMVADWLARAPGLRMLVTSRTVLRLSGEHEYRLPPLALPAITPVPELQALRASPAVQLFVQRVQLVNDSMRLDEGNTLAIAALCVRLDGLPLALELAAARCRVLSPAALLAELVRDERARLRLLSRNTTDKPGRHSSLRAAIAWSVNRLSDAERRAFARLTVLPTDCPLDAALAVADTDLAVLEGLCEHSLLRIEHRSDEARLHMLESLREYGRELLVDADEGEAWIEAHTKLAIWCQTLLPPLKHLDSVYVNDARSKRFRREQHVLQAALEWCARADPARWLPLATVAAQEWNFTANYFTGRDWLRRFIDAPGADPLCRAMALHFLALLEERCGRSDKSLPLLEESRALYQAHGHAFGAACADVRIANICYLFDGRLNEAESLCLAALPIFVERNDDARISWTYAVLGYVWHHCGDHAGAAHWMGLSVEHAMRSDDVHGSAWMLLCAGEEDIEVMQLARARERLSLGLRYARACDNAAAELFGHLRLASVHARLGELADMRTTLREALTAADRCYVSGYIAQLAMLTALWLMPRNAAEARLALVGKALRLTPHVLDRLPRADAHGIREWLASLALSIEAIGAMQPQLLNDEPIDDAQVIAAVREALAYTP